LQSTRSSGPTDHPTRRRGWLLILVGVLVVGLVAGVLVAVLDNESESDGRAQRRGAVSVAGVAEVGSLAPDFVLPALDGGGEVRLAEFRGQPAIVNFWASWCNPCREEFPLLKKALRDHRGKGLAVIGVTYQDIPDDSRDFVEKMAATWPQGIDDGGAVAEAFGVRAIPQTFFVAPDGTIVARVFGITSQDKLDEPLRKLLTQ
jgi:cytochrome c biogenesis protein CcmG/thiol:disulfide interchange protein DsbE